MSRLAMRLKTLQRARPSKGYMHATYRTEDHKWIFDRFQCEVPGTNGQQIHRSKVWRAWEVDDAGVSHRLEIEFPTLAAAVQHVYEEHYQ